MLAQELGYLDSAREVGGRGRVVNDRNPAINAVNKSDTPVVPKKPLNKGQPAEAVEGRGVTEGNAGELPAGRTQSRETASKRLDGIRQAERFGVSQPR